MKKSKSSILRVLYASSEQSADTYYCSGVFVPDPFLCLIKGRRRIAVVSRLEYSRVRSQSKLDEVLLLEAVRDEVASKIGCKEQDVGPAEMIQYFCEHTASLSVEVPETFPSVYFLRLQELGVDVRVGKNPFFPARDKKTDEEAKAIRAGNAASAAGFRIVESVLQKSEIVGKKLIFEGAVLTSERLRILIDQACLAKGAIAQNTIVAGGDQACDPHEGGHGPLRPNELIIVDIFPRVQKTGYHGDMTRTFLKGVPSSAQRNLVNAVRAAQKAALSEVKAKVSGSRVHGAACQVFEERGFVTERREDTFVGFIHSTGHGLGLEVHEAPRVSPGAPALKTGQVITIEPGLYYPGIGGCRIEDVVRVTSDGYEKLSSFHYRWQID